MMNHNFNNVIINNYSFDIITKNGNVQKIDRNDFAYYPLQKNQQYKIVLSNKNPSRCDAHIWLGKSKIGVYRLNPWKQLTISNKKFVFNKSNSYTSNWDCNNYDNGIIQVVFKP